MLKRFKNKSLYIAFIFCIMILLNSTVVSAAETTLSWSPPNTSADGSPLTDLDGYIIYTGTESGNYTQSIDIGNTTTYTATNLTENITYYFTVTAYDTSGNESVYSNEASQLIQSPDTTPPVISIIFADNITADSADINWTTDENADSQIEYGTSIAYGNTTTLNSSLITSHIQTLSFLSSTGEATLAWSAPTTSADGSPLTDLDGYIVYSGTESGSYTQSIDVGNVTSYTVNNLTANVTYYIAVTAYDTSGNEGDYSNETSSGIQPSRTADIGSTIYYRVLSRDTSGNLTVSGNNTFTLLDTTPVDYYCDNDSDGYIDSSISGSCTGDGCQPAGCRTTAGNDCNDSDNAISPDASDDNCDGIDDNCDGSADNNYITTVITCGTGVCTSVGQLECQSGAEVNTCTPSLPTESEEATCDDLDNDCDGQVDEGCAPVIKVSSIILSEDFSGGIPSTWSAQGNWNTDNSCGQTIEYPFVEPYAIADSTCSATASDSLVTESFDTLSCSSVELTFSNQYNWYSGNIEIETSSDGGQSWTSNAYIDADSGYPSANWSDVNINNTADSNDAQVKFKYVNSTSNGFWALDNVWVTCQSSQLDFTSAVGSTSTRSIMITNSGTEDLSVNDITISGANASDFSLNGNNDCLSQTLSASETCTFDIVFSPSTSGSGNAALTISSNDPANPTSGLTLSGTGIVMANPVPTIKVNGMTGHVELSRNDNMSVTIELDPGSYDGQLTDWWVLHQYRNRWYYYSSKGQKWRRGYSTYDQKSLSNIGSIEVMNSSRSNSGFYTYYFGVDILMNGAKDTEFYYEDSITVNIQ